MPLKAFRVLSAVDCLENNAGRNAVRKTGEEKDMPSLHVSYRSNYSLNKTFANNYLHNHNLNVIIFLYRYQGRNHVTLTDFVRIQDYCKRSIV